MTAAIFWLKTRGGWRETPQDHHVEILDLNAIADDELARVLELVRKWARQRKIIEHVS